MPTIAESDTTTASTTSRRRRPQEPASEFQSPLRTNWIPTSAENASLSMNLEELLPQRVRLGKDTHMPAVSGTNVASKMDPATQKKKLSVWMAKGAGEKDKPQLPQRGGHREVPVAEEGEGPEDPPSSRSSRRHDWN